MLARLLCKGGSTGQELLTFGDVNHVIEERRREFDAGRYRSGPQIVSVRRGERRGGVQRGLGDQASPSSSPLSMGLAIPIPVAVKYGARATAVGTVDDQFIGVIELKECVLK